MRGPETIIGLSPSAVEVGQFQGGECVAYDRVAIPPGDWASNWSKQLRPLDAALQQSIRKLGIDSRRSVEVVYSGPDTVVDVVSLNATGDDALRAAGLSLAEGMPGTVGSAPSHVEILAADPEGADRLTHVLAVAERDESASVVVEWVRRAGLSVRTLIPAGALAVQAAVRELLAGDEKGTRSLLLLGEHRTIIAAANGGSLRCVRSVAFGFEALADAVVRASSVATEERAEGGPGYETALRVLLTAGIPRRDQPMGIGDLRGESVLPFLQPVLQRLVVEIKQTLRFAVGESELARSHMVLTGTGSAIPRFAELLSGQIEIPVTVSAGAKMRLVDEASELAGASRMERSGFRFLPHVEVTRREGRLRNRCLAAGAGLAGVLLAGDALLAMSAKRDVDAGVATLLPRLGTVREEAALRASAADMGLRVGAEERAVREALGECPDWGALFGEIANLSAHPIRLLEVSVTQTINGYSASIRGLSYVEKTEQGEASDSLGAYITTLQGSPLICSVELGSTRLGEVDGKSVKYFLVTARLTGLPVSFAEWEARP